MSIKLAWKDIDWKLVQKRLSRQQRRVYKASMEGNRAKVNALQRRIISSWDARLIAVRQVSIENSRYNTLGVDRQIVISNEMKLKLASKLKLDGKASSKIRISTLKSGKNTVHFLGLLLITDRAKQILAKLALEPEWEAIFEPNSYGFRPGKSYRDAIVSVFFSLRGKSRYILSVNTQKCFDRIDHKKLLAKLATFDKIEYQIQAWLQAKIMREYLNKPEEIIQSMESNLQKLIISPLLVNIMLHGLENYLKEWYSSNDLSQKVLMRNQKSSIEFSRYEDSFIIIAPNLSDLQQIEKQVTLWLSEEARLSMSKIKIKIVNSAQGFDFLDFYLISLRSTSINQYKLKIHPSKLSKQRLIDRTRKIIQANRSASSYKLINLLTPKIIVWATYFQYSECYKDFSNIDYAIFQQLRAWVFRRKSKGLQARTKLKEKYFPSGKTYVFREKKYRNNWILVGQTFIKGQKKENFLPKMVWIGSSQPVKVDRIASSHDGNYIY